MPPTMGSTQKSQSCEIAQSPTKRATAVLLAGLTDVLVTGMLMGLLLLRTPTISREHARGRAGACLGMVAQSSA